MVLIYDKGRDGAAFDYLRHHLLAPLPCALRLLALGNIVQETLGADYLPAGKDRLQVIGLERRPSVLAPHIGLAPRCLARKYPRYQVFQLALPLGRLGNPKMPADNVSARETEHPLPFRVDILES